MSKTDGNTILITVHGTSGGTDPKENPEDAKSTSAKKWWDGESDFIAELKSRIDLDAEGVDVEPFCWTKGKGSRMFFRPWRRKDTIENGPNSETKRRQSGHRLFDLLSDYEDAGKKYYLIGHSHGGSVIYSALLHSIRQDKHLNGLIGWCTVGTPFLDYRQNRLQYQRLGNFGLSLYASAISALLLFLLLLIAAGIGLAAGDMDGNAIQWVSLALASLFIFVVASKFVLGFLERKRHSRFSDQHKKEVYAVYKDRWLGLWHRDDEAIAALRNIKSVYEPVVPANFLSPVVSTLQYTLMFATGIVAVIGVMFEWGWVVDAWDQYLFEPMREAVDGNIIDMVIATLWVSLVLSTFCVVFWLGAAFLRRFALIIGYPISAILNRIIWTSVRERAWGDDIVPERVREVRFCPPEFYNNFDVLPDCVEEALDVHSNNNAVNTLRQVRRALGMRGGPPKSADLRGSLEQSMNWSELIHTSYFHVQKFIDLIALGMAEHKLAKVQPGFDQQCDDVKEMNAWLAEQPNSEPVRERSEKSLENLGIIEGEDAESDEPERRGWFGWLRRRR